MIARLISERRNNVIAYKGFDPGLICRGYQFHMGLNVTDKANCRANGFHCAENPLDCLSYYSDMTQAEYYIVEACGDIDEDDCDSKIACTLLNIIKRLTVEEFFSTALLTWWTMRNEAGIPRCRKTVQRPKTVMP